MVEYLLFSSYNTSGCGVWQKWVHSMNPHIKEAGEKFEKHLGISGEFGLAFSG